MKGLKDDRKLSILETISRKINDISDYNQGLTNLMETLGDMVGAEFGWLRLHNYFVKQYFDGIISLTTPDNFVTGLFDELKISSRLGVKAQAGNEIGFSHIGVPVIRNGNLLASLVFRARPGAGFDNSAVGRLSDFTEFFASHFESAVLEKVISQGFMSTIECLALALEAKDLYTVGHSNMVCAYSITIAREMGLPPKTIDEIEVGSIMHDIGKIGIDDRVLKKETKLTDEEFAMIRMHPVIGEQILMPLHQNLFSTIRMIIRNHHERMDGRGYPDGLMGNELPIETRIVMCADAFEAMTSNRPYRDALPINAAIEEVRRCAGTQFDPEVANILCNIMAPSK